MNLIKMIPIYLKADLRKHTLYPKLKMKIENYLSEKLAEIDIPKFFQFYNSQYNSENTRFEFDSVTVEYARTYSNYHNNIVLYVKFRFYNSKDKENYVDIVIELVTHASGFWSFKKDAIWMGIEDDIKTGIRENVYLSNRIIKEFNNFFKNYAEKLNVEYVPNYDLGVK